MQQVGAASANPMGGLVASPMPMQYPGKAGGWGAGMTPFGGVMSGLGQMGSNYNMVGTMPVGYPMAGFHPASNPMTLLHHASVFPNMGSGMPPPPGLVNAMGAAYPHPSQDRYHS